jgi:predicted  nucleic acid-binding Zn-ribbon protein
MADNIENIISSISEKAKRLKEKTIRLEKENKTYRETIFKHLAAISNLQNQLKSAQASKNADVVATYTNADIGKLKKDIDQYVKVIDKAMAQLQKE